MDERIQKVLKEKIHESISHRGEIDLLEKSLGSLLPSPRSFTYGIRIGRLYNSFYYQSRRILKRNPTEQEFSEFIQLLKDHYDEFRELSVKFRP